MSSVYRTIGDGSVLAILIALCTVSCGGPQATTKSSAPTVTTKVSSRIASSAEYTSELGLTIESTDKLDCFNLADGGGWCATRNLRSVLLEVGYLKDSPFVISGAVTKGRVEAIEGTVEDAASYSLATLANVFFLKSSDPAAAARYTSLRVIVVTDDGLRLTCPLRVSTVRARDCMTTQ
jgi:hypothetical protein